MASCSSSSTTSVLPIWGQKEILASKTLSDIATLPNHEKDKLISMSMSSNTYRDLHDDSHDKANGFPDSNNWSHFQPKPLYNHPPQLQKMSNSFESNHTPQKGLYLPDELLDVAQALEQMKSKDRQSFVTQQSNVAMSPQTKRAHDEEAATSPTQATDMSMMKPKKKRRKRDQIERNFKCYIQGCNKSYGSEGALKTHVKLKHTDVSGAVKMAMPTTAGASSTSSSPTLSPVHSYHHTPSYPSGMVIPHQEMQPTVMLPDPITQLHQMSPRLSPLKLPLPSISAPYQTNMSPQTFQLPRIGDIFSSNQGNVITLPPLREQ